MKSIDQLLQNNPPESLMVAAGIAFASFIVLTTIRALLVRKLQKWAKLSETHWDDLFADILASTHNISLLAISGLIAFSNLHVSARMENWIQHGFTLMLFFQIGLWVHRGIRGWRDIQVAKHKEMENGAAAVNYGIIAFLGEMALWIIVALLVLDNLGINITTLVASLGIGGIAVALAVQNILGDLFASLSIALDKPFVVGDFIVIDSMMGTVKHVGLKTTRVQSLSGEELIFSNADLLRSRIRNYKHLAERRIVFEIGVEFDTPVEKLKRINEIIRDAVNAEPCSRLDRTHFKKIGASSLDFEVVYYVLDADYARYMDIQQNINLTLMARMAAEGIAFAFPTQTLHIASTPQTSH